MVKKSTNIAEKETQESLIEIRCPFSRTSKEGKLYACETLCVRVESNSSGEAWCRWCKLPFNFEVGDETRTFIKVKNANTSN